MDAPVVDDVAMGMYGLRLTGLPVSTAAAVGWAAPGEPTMQIRVEAVQCAENRLEPGANRFGPDHAILGLPEGVVEISRSPLVTRFLLHRRLPAAALVHPYLAYPAAVASNWLGRSAFHSGAVAVDGLTIAVVGPKEAGKSSTLAACSQAGMDVLADDLLVVHDGLAFPGPRSVDLRVETRHLFGAVHIGQVGSRDRWRLTLAPAAGPSRLAAFVRLTWGDNLRLTEIPKSERISAILDAAALGKGVLPAEAPLHLCDLPWWELSRPRDLAVLDEVVGLLRTVRTLLC